MKRKVKRILITIFIIIDIMIMLSLLGSAFSLFSDKDDDKITDDPIVEPGDGSVDDENIDTSIYSGTTWVFPESFDTDSMSSYIETYGEQWYGHETDFLLAFDINFSIVVSSGYNNYRRMEFHNNGDEGTGILYYLIDEPDTYGYVGDWINESCWQDDYARTIILNEAPSVELLRFLNTFATQKTE